jgi:biopolymer transport protein ExbB/TolQ
MMEFTFKEMIIQGWPVLSVLFVGSILSITVIVDRYVTLRRARLNAERFVAKVLKVVEAQGINAALAYSGQFSQPAAFVVRAVLEESGGDRAAKERAAQNAMQAQILELEKWVPILGTTGSVAPFVGLLGTVSGIIKAFIDMATHAGGGVEVVAAGIAEALITTGVGLFVAIPAVIGYNYCVNKIRRLAGEIDVAVFHLIESPTLSGAKE